jgi:AraC-like DNA-binding protein
MFPKCFLSSLHAYRTELRLRHALERLLERREHITQIALDLGFSSHSHFTAAFRRAFGLTPSAFIRQARAAIP